MDRKQHVYLVTLGLCILALGVFGCEPIGSKAVQLDTSSQSRQFLVDSIHGHAEKATGFRAYGTSYHGFVDEEGKSHTFNFQCRLWFTPSQHVRLISHATMRGNIDLGCNQDEFWMAIKPEISTYYWGRWDRALDEGLLPINPKVVLEAIGIVDMGDPGDWVLEEKEDNMVLTRTYAQAGLIKQVRVHRKSLRIKYIQYSDTDGTPLIVANLAGHRARTKDFAVPTIIRVTAFERGKKVGWITLKLKDFRADDLSPKKFKRPSERGFEHIIDVTREKPAF